MYLPPPLTEITPPASKLLARLEEVRAGSLPGWVWKDLFLLALRWLIARKQPVLAQLGANAALMMIDHHGFDLSEDERPGEGKEATPDDYYPSDTEFWSAVLQRLHKMPVGRGRLDKLTRSIDPLSLFLCYRLLRRRLEKAKQLKQAKQADEQRATALRKFRKLTHGTEEYLPRFLEIVKRHRPSTAALEIVALSHGRTSESLRTIFKRHRFSLEVDELPKNEGTQDMI